MNLADFDTIVNLILVAFYMNNDSSTYNYSITFCAIYQYKNEEVNNVIGMFNNIKNQH